MPYRWPADTVFTRIELHVEDRWCRTCGCKLTVCDHCHRRLFTLNEPLHIVSKLTHCPARMCPARTLLAGHWVWLTCQLWYAAGFVVGWAAEVWKSSPRGGHHV